MPRILRPRARASLTTRSVALHIQLFGPPSWIEFQSMSISNHLAPESATAWSLRCSTSAGSHRIMLPALMPTRSASGVPGPLAFTEGAFADSLAGDGVALVNGIGLATEHPASSVAPR